MKRISFIFGMVDKMYVSAYVYVLSFTLLNMYLEYELIIDPVMFMGKPCYSI